jgi:phosphatidyl-myo-inositol dimannoside synthase
VSVPWSRVIVITPGASGMDGVSAVTRLYVRALADQVGSGVEALEVWSFGDDRDASSHDPRVTFRGFAGRRFAFALRGLYTNADARTLVIVQHVHLLPIALPLAWRGARVMLLLHGVEAWKPLRTLERAGCRAAWKLAAVSAHTAARFRDANPEFAARTVEVCAPAISTTPDASAGRAARPAFAALRPGKPYALIVGRMAAAERYKGHDLLIDLWPSVRRSVPDAQLVIAGGGDDRTRLEQKAVSLGLERAVQFEGVVSDDRLAALYRGASLFVMPSPNEGFGLVYVEAMAAGTPCIVAAGAAEEIVEHGATGMVVAPGDREGLERTIVQLLTRSDERNRMGAAAAEAARSRFGPGAFAARLYAMLQLPEVSAAC